MLGFNGFGTGNINLYLRDNLFKELLCTNNQGQKQLSIDVNWFHVYAISIISSQSKFNYLVFFFLIMLLMHHLNLNTIFLRCFPYHFTCKFKRKCLIFYSIFCTYSKQEPSISSPLQNSMFCCQIQKLLPQSGS